MVVNAFAVRRKERGKASKTRTPQHNEPPLTQKNNDNFSRHNITKEGARRTQKQRHKKKRKR